MWPSRVISVFDRHIVSQVKVIAVHFGACLAALLGVWLCVTLSPSLGPGVDIHVSDSYFIVAHRLFSIAPSACLAAVSLVAWRCQTINLLLRLSWVVLGIHRRCRDARLGSLVDLVKRSRWAPEAT